MNRISVQVRISDAGDKGMLRRGLLASDQVRSYWVEALVNTDEVHTILPIHIPQHLGLATVSKARAEYANGFVEEVDVAEPVEFEINTRRATEEAMVLGQGFCKVATQLDA